MKVLLVKPRGFCAGVVRAVEIVDYALERFDHPIYVRKEIVHNRNVVDGFKARGVVFVDSLEEVPEGKVAIFSAHGVSPQVWQEAKARNLHVIDATCPLVTKVHLEVHRYVKAGYEIVLIGHKEHDEVVGTMGEAPGRIYLIESEADVEKLAPKNPKKIVCLTQTTLSVDETREIFQALKKKYPATITPPKDDICYATQNRQDAVKTLVKEGIELLLVIGSKNSSNSVRLCDVAQYLGVKAHLIDGAQEIKWEWLEGVNTVGLTAGASAPEHLVQELLEFFQKRGAQIQELEVVEEKVNFALPAELVGARA